MSSVPLPAAEERRANGRQLRGPEEALVVQDFILGIHSSRDLPGATILTNGLIPLLDRLLVFICFSDNVSVMDVRTTIDRPLCIVCICYS